LSARKRASWAPEGRKVPVERDGRRILTETVDADLDNHVCECDWEDLVVKREELFC
jgi:hypothetical protein